MKNLKTAKDFIGLSLRSKGESSLGDIIKCISIDPSNRIIAKRYNKSSETWVETSYTFDSLKHVLLDCSWELLKKKPVNAAVEKFTEGKSSYAFVTQPLILKKESNVTTRVPRGAILGRVIRDFDDEVFINDDTFCIRSMEAYVRDDSEYEYEFCKQTVDPRSLLPFSLGVCDSTTVITYATGHIEVYDNATGKLR